MNGCHAGLSYLSMKTKPVTPYARLKRELSDAWDKVQYRHTVTMQFYPNAKSDVSWKLSDLAHKVDAADQLGYDVVLSNKPDGLHVSYVKKLPTRPLVLTY